MRSSQNKEHKDHTLARLLLRAFGGTKERKRQKQVWVISKSRVSVQKEFVDDICWGRGFYSTGVSSRESGSSVDDDIIKPIENLAAPILRKLNSKDVTVLSCEENMRILASFIVLQLKRSMRVKRTIETSAYQSAPGNWSVMERARSAYVLSLVVHEDELLELMFKMDWRLLFAPGLQRFWLPDGGVYGTYSFLIQSVGETMNMRVVTSECYLPIGPRVMIGITRSQAKLGTILEPIELSDNVVMRLNHLAVASASDLIISQANDFEPAVLRLSARRKMLDNVEFQKAHKSFFGDFNLPKGTLTVYGN